MGTRNLICVVKNGEYKVSQYGQWDGYPDGQGLGVLNFLTNEFNRELFESKLENIAYITHEEYKDRWLEFGHNIDEGDGFVDWNLVKKFDNKYPELSRDTGSNILSIIQNATRPIRLKDAIDFAADSLFCEWAYVIDLDKNTFEIYEGFNQKPLTEEERFYNMKQLEYNLDDKYYPVKHVITFNINNLPTKEEFLNSFKSEDKEE